MVCVAFCAVQQYWSEDEVGSVIDRARYVCPYRTYLFVEKTVWYLYVVF